MSAVKLASCRAAHTELVRSHCAGQIAFHYCADRAGRQPLDQAAHGDYTNTPIWIPENHGPGVKICLQGVRGTCSHKQIHNKLDHA